MIRRSPKKLGVSPPCFTGVGSLLTIEYSVIVAGRVAIPGFLGGDALVRVGFSLNTWVKSQYY